MASEENTGTSELNLAEVLGCLSSAVLSWAVDYRDLEKAIKQSERWAQELEFGDMMELLALCEWGRKDPTSLMCIQQTLGWIREKMPKYIAAWTRLGFPRGQDEWEKAQDEYCKECGGCDEGQEDKSC